MNSTTKSWILGLALLGLASCAGSDITDAKRTTGRDPSVAEVPDAHETVRGENDPPIVTLELGSTLREHRLSTGDALPGKIVIPTTNLSAVPITSALQAVLSGTDVSLAWDTGTLSNRLVTVMNLTGTLPQVVEKICSAAKVFCSYRGGSLEISETETFIVPLPPAIKKASGATTNTMVETINALIGGKAQVDDQGGNILYTTDYIHEAMAHQYLEELRNGRPLIVLQLYVWDVTLNKENTQGINWTQFDPGIFGPGFAKLALSSVSAFSTAASAPTGGFTVGAVTTGKLKTSSVLEFLSTQGRVQNISSPQVTFVSGSSSSLKIGGTLRYISQVGSNTANASGTTTASSSNTVSTDSIDTGLTIDVDGAYENGVVLANLNLSLKNLVSLHPTSTSGTTSSNSGSTTSSDSLIVDLPETTDEKMSTVIRVRPGDNLVLAGIVTSNDTNTRQGLPLGDSMRIPTYGDDTLQNRELVVMVKPSVVLFSDKASNMEAKKHEEAMPNEAVVIDKDGAKMLTLPHTASAPMPVVSSASAPAPLNVPDLATATIPASAAIATASPTVYSTEPTKPELMVTDPNAVPTNNIPVSASDDTAPVDRRLMQRGFSHAFDQLLQPAGGTQ